MGWFDAGDFFAAAGRACLALSGDAAVAEGRAGTAFGATPAGPNRAVAAARDTWLGAVAPAVGGVIGRAAPLSAADEAEPGGAGAGTADGSAGCRGLAAGTGGVTALLASALICSMVRARGAVS
jgi:hypothetical protein